MKTKTAISIPGHKSPVSANGVPVSVGCNAVWCKNPESMPCPADFNFEKRGARSLPSLFVRRPIATLFFLRRQV
jgi:hypothetical protein